MQNSLFNNVIYLDDIPKEKWHDYIGNGYRSACYLTDAEKNGRIVLFGFDKVGNRKTFVAPWQSYVKYNVKYKTNELDIYDRYVATKYFKNKKERDNYVKNCSYLNIVECFSPEMEFLHFMFKDHVFDDDFNKQDLRIHYLDIENEISDKFEPPCLARNRLNMITIYDSQTEKFYTWSLDKVKIEFKEDPLKNYDKDKFVVFEFDDNERRMLTHFIDWFENNFPDVIFGWNIQLYDLPYIFRRIENVLGKEFAKRLSPVGKYFIKKIQKTDGSGNAIENTDSSDEYSENDEIEVKISGIFNSDGLILYRDKFGIGRPDGGFTLDNIGEYEGCGNKIHYDGTLKDLYLKDWQKFYEYNVRDVDLVKRIDDKCKMIRLARQIVSFGLTDYNQIYGSIRYLVGSVTLFGKQIMNRTLVSYQNEKSHFSGFEGAFVFPTTQGIYRNGIACIDFASLYPSTIRAINASPETYIGKVIVEYKDDVGNIVPHNLENELPFDIWDDKVAKAENVNRVYLLMPNNTKKEVTVDKLRAWINLHGIYTSNNTIFRKHEEKFGIITKWCEYFYSQRKTTKKKMMKIFHYLNENEKKITAEEKFQKETEEENLNSLQLGYKAMINSIYGILGTPFSPIANPNIAQSITRMGRFCNINASKFVLKYFNENYDKNYKGFRIKIDERLPPIDVSAISGDTDSQFIDLAPVTNWMRCRYDLPEKIKDWPTDKRQELWNTMSEMTEKQINKFVRDLVHEYSKTSQQDVLTYELEYLSDVGVYESKKHYFTHKIFEEGDKVDKIKVTGIELKKNQVPKSVKKFLQDIYEGVVINYWTESDYQNYVSQLFDKFKKLSIEDIAFWKGYSTERKAAGFLQMQVGTTGIAKACIYYNQIIEKLGLGNKYDTIMVGDKVRFVYLTHNNKYGINCIAYKPGFWPKEFDSIFEVDYKTMFEKIILDPLKRFREACKFQNFNPDKQVQFDIFDL